MNFGDKYSWNCFLLLTVNNFIKIVLFYKDSPLVLKQDTYMYLLILHQIYIETKETFEFCFLDLLFYFLSNC